MDMDAKQLHLMPATIPYYDPKITRMIYLRDVFASENGEGLFKSIVILEINSGEELWVREDPGADEFQFFAAWSSNGQQVVIHDGWQFMVVNLDAGWDRMLQKEGLAIEREPTWSPDGRYLAIKTYDGLAVYDPVRDILTDYPDDCFPGNVLEYSWSPHGHQLAVGLAVDGWMPEDSKYVLVINVDTKTAVNFVEEYYFLLGWLEAENK